MYGIKSASTSVPAYGSWYVGRDVHGKGVVAWPTGKRYLKSSKNDDGAGEKGLSEKQTTRGVPFGRSRMGDARVYRTDGNTRA